MATTRATRGINTYSTLFGAPPWGMDIGKLTMGKVQRSAASGVTIALWITQTDVVCCITSSAKRPAYFRRCNSFARILIMSLGIRFLSSGSGMMYATEWGFKRKRLHDGRGEVSEHSLRASTYIFE